MHTVHTFWPWCVFCLCVIVFHAFCWFVFNLRTGQTKILNNSQHVWSIAETRFHHGWYNDRWPIKWFQQGYGSSMVDQVLNLTSITITDQHYCPVADFSMVDWSLILFKFTCAISGPLSLSGFIWALAFQLWPCFFLPMMLKKTSEKGV